MAPKIPKQLSKAQIAEASAKHKAKVSIVAFPIGEDQEVVNNAQTQEATFYVIPPSRNVLDLIAQLGTAKKFDKANQVLLKNCVLAGDMEYIEEGHEKCDDGIYYGLIGFISELSSKKQGKLKN